MRLHERPLGMTALFLLLGFQAAFAEEPSWFTSADSAAVVVHVPNVLRKGNDKIKLSNWAQRLRGKTALPVRVVSTTGKQVVLFPEDKIEIRVGGRWRPAIDSTWRDQLQVSKVWSDSTVAVQGIALFERVRLSDIDSVRITMQGEVLSLTRTAKLR